MAYDNFLQTWGAATQIRGELKTKTKSVIAAWFGIPGDLTQPEIISLVTWLVENGNFKYGGLNTQVLSCSTWYPHTEAESDSYPGQNL